MNKSELYDYFDQIISKTAIKQRDDGEWQVVGKWCAVSFDDDGSIDLFICNPKDMVNGLGQRKLNNTISGLKSKPTTKFTELDGEAWAKVADKAVILDNLRLLGIRRKKVVTNINPSFGSAV